MMREVYPGTLRRREVLVGTWRAQPAPPPPPSVHRHPHSTYSVPLRVSGHHRGLSCHVPPSHQQTALMPALPGDEHTYNCLASNKGACTSAAGWKLCVSFRGLADSPSLKACSLGVKPEPSIVQWLREGRLPESQEFGDGKLQRT